MIAPPRPPADPEALIPEARDRQRRRRVLVAASVSSAAAVGLTFYALLGGVGQSGRSDGSPRAATPSCRASQLAATAFLKADLGSPPGGAAIENTSASACALPTGRPAVDLVWRGASLNPRQEILHGPFTPRVSILAPHRRAVVYALFYTAHRCVAVPKTAPVRPTLVVRFRSGLTVQARTPPTDWAGSSGCYSRWVAEVSPVVADS